MATDRFQIKPARSRFDNLVAGPEPVPDIKPPAQPNREQVQQGGQLLDASSFQPGDSSAINQIEDFLKEGGLLNRSKEFGMQAWKDRARENADNYRRARRWFEAAEDANLKAERRTEIVEALRKKGYTKESMDVALSDRWTKFYIDDNDAFNAGVNAAIKLKSRINDDLNFVASLPDVERGIYIQQQADNLLVGTEHLPRAAVNARIDPLIAQITAEAKANAQERALQLEANKITIKTRNSFMGSLMRVSSLTKIKGEGAETPITIEQAFLGEHRSLTQRHGKTYHDATDIIVGLIKENMYVDNDGDGLNDFGQDGALSLTTIYKALEGKKTGPKEPLFLDLTTSDGKTSIRRALMDAAHDANQKNSARSKQAAIEANGKLFSFKARLQRNAKQKWLSLPENYTFDDVKKLRTQLEEEIAAMDDNTIPDGWTEKTERTFLDNTLPLTGTTSPDGSKELMKSWAERLVKEKKIFNIEDAPEDFQAALRDPSGHYYDFYGDVVGVFAKAETTQTQERIAELDRIIPTYITNAKKQLEKTIWEKDPTIVALRKVNTQESRNEIKRYKEAVMANISEMFAAEADTELRALFADVKDLDDKIEVNGVFQNYMESVKDNPMWSDIDTWLEVNPANPKLRTVREIGQRGNVQLGYKRVVDSRGGVTYEPTAKHIIEINDPYNGRSFGTYLQSKFAGDKDKYLNEYLNGTIVLSQDSLDGWTAALSGGDLSLITKDMREELANMSTLATDGAVAPWQVLEKTLQLYEGNGDKHRRKWMYPNPAALQQAIKRMAALTNTVDGIDAEQGALDRASIKGLPFTTVKDGEENFSTRYRIQKGSDLQGGNEVSSPVNGQIVEVGNNKTNGNYVVVQANSQGSYWAKGDLIKISNLANVSSVEGEQITRNGVVGLQGNDSELGSTELSTTGTGITPGEIDIQVMNKDGEQYGANTQRNFYNGAVVSLIQPVSELGVLSTEQVIPMGNTQRVAIETAFRTMGINLNLKDLQIHGPRIVTYMDANDGDLGPPGEFTWSGPTKGSRYTQAKKDHASLVEQWANLQESVRPKPTFKGKEFSPSKNIWEVRTRSTKRGRVKITEYSNDGGKTWTTKKPPSTK